MSTKKAIAAITASSLLALLSLSPVYAEEEKEKSIPEMEKEQVDSSAKPDVDPNASKGPDKPIPEQEKKQME
jgi:hypothetical protein